MSAAQAVTWLGTRAPHVVAHAPWCSPVSLASERPKRVLARPLCRRLVVAESSVQLSVLCDSDPGRVWVGHHHEVPHVVADVCGAGLRGHSIQRLLLLCAGENKT